MVTKTIRFFDMFSGVGGFREGLSRAGGFICVGHCEIDKYAEKSYRLLFDTEGEWYCDDARKMQPDDMPGFDLLCGEDFLARLSQLLEKEPGSQTREELSSLRSPEWLEKSDLKIFYLKMYPDCFRITKARRSIPSSVRYQTWGITWSGRCLTARISESPSPENACILSDILMKDVPEKYYLSREQTERLLYKSFRAVKGAESTPQKE